VHRVHPQRQLFYEALGEALIEYAERWFYLNEYDDAGKTRRDRLIARLSKAEKRNEGTKAADIAEELRLPSFPTALDYIWSSYIRMRRRKSPGFASHNPLGWDDFKAFSEVTGMRFSAWEISLLEEIDDAFLKPEPPVTIPDSGDKKVRAVSSALDGEGVKSILGSVGTRRVVVRTGKVGTT